MGSTQVEGFGKDSIGEWGAGGDDRDLWKKVQTR